MKSWQLILGAVGVSAIALAAAYVLVFKGNNSRISPATAQAQSEAAELQLPKGLSVDAYRRAEKWFRDRYASQTPSRDEILYMAGDLAAADKNPDTALACYRAIPTTSSKTGLAARLQEGMLLVELNRANEAEAALRDYIEAARVAPELQRDDVVTAFKWLNYILSVEIRQEERKHFLGELHTIGLADPLDSKQYFFPNLLILNSPGGRTRTKKFLEKDPQNVTLLTAQGRYKTLEGQFDDAIALLERLLAEHPGDVRIGAALLEACYESDDLERFDAVLQELPAYAPFEPWLLTRMRGAGAMEAKRYDDALRYFKAVLEEDPANAPAQMGLARAYQGIGDEKAQAEALRRSGILAEIRVNLTSVQPNAAAAATELAQKCEAIHFDAAAKVFHLHAEAIKRQAPGLGARQPATP